MGDTLMGLVAVGTQLVASLWDLVEIVHVQRFLKIPPQHAKQNPIYPLASFKVMV